MSEDDLYNFNSNHDFEDQDEHEEEFPNGSQEHRYTIMDNEDNELETSNVMTNENDISEFSSLVFVKSLKDLQKKFKVISVELFEVNLNASSRFSKVEKFKNIKKYKVQCISCKGKFSCFPSTNNHMIRHVKVILFYLFFWFCPSISNFNPSRVKRKT